MKKHIAKRLSSYFFTDHLYILITMGHHSLKFTLRPRLPSNTPIARPWPRVRGEVWH